MKTKLSDIKITGAFKKTHPNLKKLLKCMTYYAKYGKLDRDVVLTKKVTKTFISNKSPIEGNILEFALV